MIIRSELPEDIEPIWQINQAAFKRDSEANLVDGLRAGGKTVASLVAADDELVIGHILFSLVTIRSEREDYQAVGLAPMAVLPEYQRTGVGTELIRVGIKHIKASGHGGIIVLGHPEFYPRFGFVPASNYGIRCPFEVPDEAFMALELASGALKPGVAIYPDEFNDV